MIPFLDLETPAMKRQRHALNKSQSQFERESWKRDVLPALLLAAVCFLVGAVLGACVMTRYFTTQF